MRQDGEEPCELAQRGHERELAEIDARFERSRRSFTGVQDAIATLTQITSPVEMLAAAPAVLCASSELDQVLLSTVERGSLVAQAACFRDRQDQAQAVLSELACAPMALEHPLHEAQALRRGRATLVADVALLPRESRKLASIIGWRSYVVAPVALGTQTIALLHAARDRGPLEEIHRDALWKFATGLAAAHESAALRRRLRSERQRTRRFLHGLDVRLAGFAEDAVRFGSHTSRMGSPSRRVLQASAAGESVLADVFTRREIEILRLLADGLTNRAIADLLVVSNGTVKFHVNRILRKLRAANRAEAVSRYLTLTGLRPRQDREP